MKLKKIFNKKFCIFSNGEVYPCFYNNKDSSFYKYDNNQDDLLFFKKHLILPISDMQRLSLVGGIGNYTIYQNGEARMDAKPLNNEIYIYETIAKKLVSKYTYNVVLYDNKGDGFFSALADSNENEFHYFDFNPLTKEKREILIVQGKREDIRIISNNETMFFLYNSKKHSIHACLKENNEDLWENNLSYLRSNDDYSVGTDYFRLGRTTYNKKTNQLLMFYDNGMLVSIDGESGIVKWHIEKSFISDAVIDPDTGNIYYKGSYRKYNNRSDDVILKVLNTEGKIISATKLTEEQLKMGEYCPHMPINALSSRIGLLDMYGGYLYLIFESYPLLYKINKYSLVVEEVYKHDKSFYRSFIFYENRLIISDLYSIYENKNRLLVFELDSLVEVGNEASLFPPPFDEPEFEDADKQPVPLVYDDDEFPF